MSPSLSGVVTGMVTIWTKYLGSNLEYPPRPGNICLPLGQKQCSQEESWIACIPLKAFYCLCVCRSVLISRCKSRGSIPWKILSFHFGSEGSSDFECTLHAQQEHCYPSPWRLKNCVRVATNLREIPTMSWPHVVCDDINVSLRTGLKGNVKKGRQQSVNE